MLPKFSIINKIEEIEMLGSKAFVKLRGNYDGVQ